MLGEDHTQTIGALNSIGYTYKLQGRFDQAMENYQKEYDLSVNRFGEDHQLTVTCLVNIGYLESCLEHYDKAAAVFDRVLRIKKNIYMVKIIRVRSVRRSV